MEEASNDSDSKMKESDLLEGISEEELDVSDDEKDKVKVADALGVDWSQLITPKEVKENKVVELKGHELATGCDVITIGEEEPEVKKPTVEQEASIPIEVHVVEDCVGVADAKGEEYLSAADMGESDASCDEEDMDWDSETLAWAMGSDAEMRPKNSRCHEDQILR